MPYNADKHNRRSIRLRSHDYSLPGAYFITIATQGRVRLFGAIEDEEIRLNAAGEMVAAAWRALPQRFVNVEIDAFIVMPDHIHGILLLAECMTRPDDQQASATAKSGSTRHRRPNGTSPGSVSRIVQAFKSISTHTYSSGVALYGWSPFLERLWQRNYYERIVRDERMLAEVRAYIASNPQRTTGEHVAPSDQSRSE